MPFDLMAMTFIHYTKQRTASKHIEPWKLCDFVFQWLKRGQTHKEANEKKKMKKHKTGNGKILQEQFEYKRKIVWATIILSDSVSFTKRALFIHILWATANVHKY